MKKNDKKLSLRTETVRTLEAAALAAAAGGATVGISGKTTISCPTYMSCPSVKACSTLDDPA